MAVTLNGEDVFEMNFDDAEVEAAFWNQIAVFSGDDTVISIEATRLPDNDEYETEPPVLTPQSLSGLELTAHYASGRSAVLSPDQYVCSAQYVDSSGWVLKVIYRGTDYILSAVRFKIMTYWDKYYATYNYRTMKNTQAHDINYPVGTSGVYLASTPQIAAGNLDTGGPYFEFPSGEAIYADLADLPAGTYYFISANGQHHIAADDPALDRGLAYVRVTSVAANQDYVQVHSNYWTLIIVLEDLDGEPYYIAGDYIGTVRAEKGTYPENGRSGNYYYIWNPGGE